MNQELVAAQPCSPFSVVRDVVDDITFGDDAVFNLMGSASSGFLYIQSPFALPMRRVCPIFRYSWQRRFGGIPVHKSVVPVLQGKVPFGYRTWCALHGFPRYPLRHWEVWGGRCETWWKNVRRNDRYRWMYLSHHVAAVFKDFIDGIVRQPLGR